MLCSADQSLCLLCTGRWEARVGVPGSKHVYLGLYEGEEEAARAYDSSLVRLRGSSAATNFALSEYKSDLAAYHKLHQVRRVCCDCCCLCNVLLQQSSLCLLYSKISPSIQSLCT